MISIKLNETEKYFDVVYSGLVTDEELLESWGNFFKANNWSPEIDLLIDLSRADLSSVSVILVKKLGVLFQNSYGSKKGDPVANIAVYAPSHSLGFGLTRMFDVFVSINVNVFTCRKEALGWLEKLKAH